MWLVLSRMCLYCCSIVMVPHCWVVLVDHRMMLKGWWWSIGFLIYHARLRFDSLVNQWAAVPHGKISLYWQFILPDIFAHLWYILPICSHTDLQGDSNGYSVLQDGEETEHPKGDFQRNEACVHSSDEDEEKEGQNEEQHDGEAIESPVAAHDCSGSRPLLLDSEDEDEQGAQLMLHSSPHSGTIPTQPSTTIHQPTPSTFAQNHFQHVQEPAVSTDVTAYVFSKAPFQIAQEDSGDVFANAPFPRAPTAAQQQLDVFSQAPFGKRKEATRAQLQTSCPHAAGVHAVVPDQCVLGQVTQQPFRPQALAKYSRHFEGPVPQQPVAAHRVVSNESGQTTVASVPVGPLYSLTSEVSSVDPFVSAPFHFKAPQEKP